MFKNQLFIITALAILFSGCAQKDLKGDPSIDAKISEKPIIELNCPFAGTAPKWENLYCRMKMGIKKRHAKELLGCEAKIRQRLHDKSECEKMEFLKSQACELQIQLGYYNRGQITCVSDRDIEQKWLSDYDLATD